jgi:hypothetical protein
MSSPRNPPVPRLAPANSVSLVTALDAFGRAIDPDWTGEEIEADTAPEPTDDDLAHRAFAQVTREASDSPRGYIDDKNLPEHEILAALCARRDIEFAARRRWKAAAIAFLRHLHRGALLPTAMGSDGMAYDVPRHLWAAANAEDLFDNGHLEVRTGQLVVPGRPIAAEDAAIVLVNRDELLGLITTILDGNASPPPLAPMPERQQGNGGRGKPGRPSPTAQPIEEELRRRAAAGECEPTLRAEAKVLIAWAAKMYPNERHMKVEGFENRFRKLYRSLPLNKSRPLNKLCV